MYKVLIADDESIIRRGLHHIINWENLGFRIVGEASDGPNALSFILREKPDVVLIDIKMPDMDGLEVIKKARSNHYHGFFIILSGYSDFEYAQNAIQNNVSFYLIKPIHEENLEKALISIASQLAANQQTMLNYNQYVSHAKESILINILKGNCSDNLTLKDFSLENNVFQVVLYDKYNPDQQFFCHFSELLNVGNSTQNIYDTVYLDNNEVILLKGDYAIGKFKNLLSHLNNELTPQKGSLLNSVFLTYGRIVYRIEDICISYKEAKSLMARRFFCMEGEHALGASLQVISQTLPNTDNVDLSDWIEPIMEFIQTNQRTQLAEHLQRFTNFLCETCYSPKEIRMMLIDMFLKIKERFLLLYSPLEMPFPNNIQIIQTIQTRYYLYEIILYFTETFHQIIELLSPSHGEKGITYIISYIDKNYHDKLKLEDIAILFGYNSAYLGRIFYQETGTYFNAYLDQLRIEKAKELLKCSNIKISDIALSVGYSNLNYFQTRFKKAEKIGPSEYRKRHASDK